MIKLPNASRTDVTPAFQFELKSLYAGIYRKMKREIETAPRGIQEQIKHGKKPHMIRLAKALKTAEGWDLEMTKLTSLPYARLDVIEHRGELWFDWFTKPVIAEAEHFGPSEAELEYRHTHQRLSRAVLARFEQKRTTTKYDIGQYHIYWKISDLLNGGMDYVHMLPDRDPTIFARHMHHHIERQWDSNRDRELTHVVINPLDMKPHTCWGNFPNIVQGCLADGDVIQLMRTMHMFLVRLNPHSPLRRFPELPHFKEIHA